MAGTLGFLVTSLMVAALCTGFIFSLTELTTAIPHAGGPFAYSRWAFGEKGGLIFLGFMAAGFIYFQLTAQDRADAPADAMLTGL